MRGSLPNRTTLYRAVCFLQPYLGKSSRRRSVAPRRKRHDSLRISALGIAFIIASPSCVMSSIRPWRKAGSTWRRRDEPPWPDPHMLITLVNHLSFSNLPELLGSLSLSTRVFQDLPPTRTFFAHRNQSSFAAVTSLANSYGVTGRKRPSDFLMTRLPGRPQTILEDWIDDISTTVELLCW